MLTARGGRKQEVHAVLSAETASPTKAINKLPVTNYVFLGFWMVHSNQECHSLTRLDDFLAHLGQGPHNLPGNLSGLNTGGT